MKQKIVMKVQMSCDKCRTKALKIAAVRYGVISVALDGPEKDQVVVIGDGVDTACLAQSLKKKVGHTTLISVEEVKPPPPPEEEATPSITYIPPCRSYDYVCYNTRPNPGVCSIM